MIYAFIRSYIGGFGRAIMDFYIAHSFIINALILIYGLFVYLAHISYLSAYRFILERLGFDPNALKAGKKTNLKINRTDFDKLSWDEVRRTYWFPFIAPPKALWISLKTNSVLKKFFSEAHIKQMVKR